MQRLYPKTVLKPAVRTMLIPVPKTAAIGVRRGFANQADDQRREREPDGESLDRREGRDVERATGPATTLRAVCRAGRDRHDLIAPLGVFAHQAVQAVEVGIDVEIHQRRRAVGEHARR